MLETDFNRPWVTLRAVFPENSQNALLIDSGKRQAVSALYPQSSQDSGELKPGDIAERIMNTETEEELADIGNLIKESSFTDLQKQNLKMTYQNQLALIRQAKNAEQGGF